MAMLSTLVVGALAAPLAIALLRYSAHEGAEAKKPATRAALAAYLALAILLAGFGVVVIIYGNYEWVKWTFGGGLLLAAAATTLFYSRYKGWIQRTLAALVPDD